MYSPSGPCSEAISIPFLYAMTPYPVLWDPLSYDMNMYSLLSLYSSYKLVWSSAHSYFTDMPSLFPSTYRWTHLCKSWLYSDLHQGGSAKLEWAEDHTSL